MLIFDPVLKDIRNYLRLEIFLHYDLGSFIDNFDAGTLRYARVREEAFMPKDVQNFILQKLRNFFNLSFGEHAIGGKL